MDPWPSEVFGFPVIKKPIGDAGALGLIKPVSLVWHTTQGKDDEGANNTFEKDPGIGPSFTLDDDSIYQLRSLAHRAGSLKGDSTNDPHCIQIEIAAICTTKPWKLSEATAARLAAVSAYVAQYHGIPLVRPNPAWRDDCSDITGTWASTTNSRRKWAEKDDRWPNVRGVWQHLEIPGNDHWDCGALNVSDLVAQTAALLGPPPPPPPEGVIEFMATDEDITKYFDSKLAESGCSDFKSLGTQEGRNEAFLRGYRNAVEGYSTGYDTWDQYRQEGYQAAVKAGLAKLPIPGTP